MSALRSDGFLDVEAIRAGLRTRRIGGIIEIVAETTSTNDTICAAGSLLIDGRVLFAEHQSAGRGRLGRSWLSPRGASLLFSVLLKDSNDLAPGALALATAIACRDGIAAATGIEPLLQWPNDLYVGVRKLGGILIETRSAGGGAGFGRACIIGVGINCLQRPAHFPPELRGRATSLEIESTAPVHREKVAIAILGALDAWLHPPDWSDGRLREAWLLRSASLGQRVRLRHEGTEYTGCIIDLDPTADIVVQLDRGGRRSFEAARTTIIQTSFLAGR